MMLPKSQTEWQPPQFTKSLCAALTSLPVSGCSVRGAPSFILFGAFFPGWMFCAGLGLLVAAGIRAVFVATGWAAVVPYQLFVCASIGLIFGVLVCLLWFGM
jgi:hypothetical protein